jgi:phosphoglycerol transferase MdoB-like AlkP superfamily enzyme
MVIFLLFLSLILTFFTKLSRNPKVNKTIFIIFMILIFVWFSAQYVCKDYFDFYISFSLLGLADQLTDFFGKTVIETLKHLPGIIVFFIPLLLSLIFSKYINFQKRHNQKTFIYLLVALGVFGVYLLSLNIGKNKSYSAHKLYYSVNDVNLNMETFGVLNTLCIDVRRAIFGFEEKIVSIDNKNDNKKDNDKKDEPITYKYNNLDIKFDDLIANETNKTIKNMHEYFNNDSGTLQNEYTGIFKGKNLILFMAESFNEIAVSEDLTPTLYKLVNSGFSFDNFYSPTIFSTIGGEFQELTGLYPNEVLKKFRSGTVSFPMGIGNMFKNENYSVYAYHNNSYTFQDRNKYLKSLGFDNFKACYNGLEKLINCKEWPQSDVSMIDVTFDDYASEDHFMVFYASVSGHSSYTWGNASAKKHKEEYKASGRTYSEKPASYLAAQMELDRALELLIKKLDEKGILANTVIALVGDHYPYELTIDEVNEISSYKKDSVVTVNKSNFILWNSEMETIHISKVGSQIDVIPTIYNAFGLPYDSRLFIGKDILSTEPGLAIFGNRSWVSDKGTYFASSRKFVPKEDVEVEDDYVATMNKIVDNKRTMSKLIINNDYYAKVLKNN